MTQSLLSKSFAEEMLTIARQNLEQDGRLDPVLFVRLLKDGKGIITNPPLLGEYPQKAEAIAHVGHALRSEGHEIAEAAMLMESWTVWNDADYDPSQGPVRDHPSREEALVLSARNAANTRQSTFLQMFLRDEQDNLVWQKPNVQQYNQKTSEGMSMAGLLEHLFPESQGH